MNPKTVIVAISLCAWMVSCEDYSKVPPQVLAARLRAEQQRDLALQQAQQQIAARQDAQIAAQQEAQAQGVEMLRQDNAYRQQQQQLNGIQNQLGSINQQLQPPPPSSWSNPQGRTFSNPYGP